tara:strand:+ start:3545 stop:4264 length:720 start_codon:yes stop_codon:yes gene_type:complete
MDNSKKIRLILGIIYIIVLSTFLFFLFKNFSIQDFRSFEIIKSNRNMLEDLKTQNIILSALIFFLFTILWVLMLGFGSPIFLIGGFIFGKWLGTLIVLFGLCLGATILYFIANFFLKDFIYQKFESKFSYLTSKFKKNEFLYFIIYRAIGGIPFFVQNLLPVLFNISYKNYFFGSLIGLAPQLFIGVSIGAGINKIIDENSELPSLFNMFLTPDIYLPILALIIFLILAFIMRKIFFKN